MPGFVDVLYKHIVPACFGAPLQHSFDLNDGNAFVVGWRREKGGRERRREKGEGVRDGRHYGCMLFLAGSW